MFNHNCGKYQGTILNKILIFKVNTGGASKVESPLVLSVDTSSNPISVPSYVPIVNPSRAQSEQQVRGSTRRKVYNT